MARGLQRARIDTEKMALTVDLRELLKSQNEIFRPLMQWARNALNENPSGVVKLEVKTVKNLALFIGCTHKQLADYFAKFLPEED
jgi:hypothetical protein